MATRREFLCACAGASAVGVLQWLGAGCNVPTAVIPPPPTGTHDIDLTAFPALANDGSVVAVAGTPGGTIFVSHTSGDTYFALSRRCTHRGCTVGTTMPTLNCPCHGSKFNLDGSVAHGPAARPLTSWMVSKSGDLLTVHFG